MEFITDNSSKTNIQIKTFEPPKKYHYDLDDAITSSSVKKYIWNKILWIKGDFSNTINLSNCTDIDIIYFDKQSSFDSSLDSLPQTLKHLEFHPDSDFSQPINNLPQGLKILIMGHSFVEHVDNLPDSLESLILTGSFNNPIDNLPSGLETLILGEFFNQSIENLPYGLKKLVLSNNFAKSINNLPPNLIYLQFENNNNWVGNLNNLPNSIQFLFLNINSFNYSKEPVLNSLPKSIKYLEIITLQNLLFESNLNNHNNSNNSNNKKFLFSKEEIEKSNGRYLNKYNLIFI
jgi:hypothetical protein